jgi:hypothetical protein
MDEQSGERFMEIERRVEQLVDRLPRDVNTETDLWPRISACIDTSEERWIRQLPRDVDTKRDLWPGIVSGLRAERGIDDTAAATGLLRPRVAAGFGVLALAMLATLFSIQVQNTTGASSASASALPTGIDELLGQFDDAIPGTLGAELQATAQLIQRDIRAVRAERLRIERAIATSAYDLNLRNQWRHVYLAELRLINEAQKLGNLYLARSEA